MKSKRVQSVGAVFAGILMNFVPVTALDIVLHMTKVFPPMGQPMSDEQCALALAYRVLAAIGGGWVTAWLAPQDPMKHGVVLGVIGILMSGAGVLAFWDKPEFGPHWYPLAILAMAFPATWLGAKSFKG